MAGERLTSGQLGAGFGRIYALTVVGDGGCDGNEGCPIAESSFVARLGEYEGSSESSVGNTKASELRGGD